MRFFKEICCNLLLNLAKLIENNFQNQKKKKKSIQLIIKVMLPKLIKK